jgi:NCS1 family nucleobase:cation symporter-1
VVFFANLFSSWIIVLNGRAAATYHIGFPVLSRASWGLYGHYFSVILRALLGIIWGGEDSLDSELSARILSRRSSGVQLYFEGQFISLMLRCIFSSWTSIPNHIPASQLITVQDLIGCEPLPQYSIARLSSTTVTNVEI